MSARRSAPRGSALVDYIAAVFAVGVLMLALVALREHRPERRPPIDPVAHLIAPLSRPPVARPPPLPRARPVAQRPARPARPRPPRPPRPTVLAPRWAVGW